MPRDVTRLLNPRVLLAGARLRSAEHRFAAAEFFCIEVSAAPLKVFERGVVGKFWLHGSVSIAVFSASAASRTRFRGTDGFCTLRFEEFNLLLRLAKLFGFGGFVLFLGCFYELQNALLG